MANILKFDHAVANYSFVTITLRTSDGSPYVLSLDDIAAYDMCAEIMAAILASRGALSVRPELLNKTYLEAEYDEVVS